MNPVNKNSRILGVAFFLQFITPLTSGIILNQALIKDDISKTMVNIAGKSWLMRINILGEMLTAVGIIFLGAVLYVTLKKHNEKMALTAFGFYILEAVMLATSRIQAFSLLHISQEYVAEGRASYLLSMGNLAFESMNYIYGSMLMFAFCLGAILFYYLLYKSRIIPRGMSLWGLSTVILCLIPTLFVMFGIHSLSFLYIPYMPFECVVAVWILLKGVERNPHTFRTSQSS
ncbi:MAG: DUF4386 domain-containing protein [Bacillota bacterium]|nr:DUF4386 domain-containing protein [Bacillota bacterium]